MKRSIFVGLVFVELLLMGLFLSVRNIDSEPFTHCWKKGKGEGSGGFYHCPGDSSCVWVEDEDPEGEADRECDSPSQ